MGGVRLWGARLGSAIVVAVAFSSPAGAATRTATSTTPPAATLLPASVDFGTLAVGNTSAATTFTLTNNGPGNLTIASVVISIAASANPSDFSIAGGTCTSNPTLTPSQSCTALARFKPTAAGARTAVLRTYNNTASGHTDATLNGTGSTPDTTPPTAPGTVAASASGSAEIDLSWGPASDNVGVTGYQLYRCQGVGCTDFSLLARPAGTATSYNDAPLATSAAYSYQLRAVDSAANPGPFSNTASAITHPAPGFVSMGPTGRYLVDQSGTPFLIAGDSPQAMIGDLTETDAEYFFADRKAHGFNTVWINLLCRTYTGCKADGTTWDGIPPFTTPGDFSTPNEAYFAHADRIIRLAEQYGLLVILDPAETGGWLNTMAANGVDKLRAYGRFLGARYKNFPNIIWMHGNDYQSWGPTYDPYVTAVALGIRDVDTRHIHTVELNYLVSGSLDDNTWAPIISLNASYTYSPAYQQVLRDYNRSNFLPTFLVEGTYEFEQNTPSVPYGSPLTLRRQEYWSILSGATGQLYGNHYTWGFICAQRDAAGNCVDGWKSQLDTPGAIQVGYLMSLFGPRRWYNLVPDQAHTVVIGGLGTFGASDYVTAARTPDGTLAMAYVPTARTITVNMSSLNGPVTARWYDPAAGTFTQISGSPFASTGNRQFTTPGNNADGPGNEDWVLVLEAP